MERKNAGCCLLFCLLLSPLSLATARRSLVDDHALPKESYKSTSCETPTPGGSETTPSHSSGSHYPPPTAPSHSASGGRGGGDCSCGGSCGHCSIPSPAIALSPPATATPSSPLIPDPNSPPFTCYYWITHPNAIWVLFGYWGTIGQAFGTPQGLSVPFERNLSLLEALESARGDGFGLLLREGTASLLNSMASHSFCFTSQQVREGFNSGLRSEEMAAAQGKVFQKANEGHLKN